MKRMAVEKYRPFQQVDLPDRQWPNRIITKAPIWCSVDLRDGNQALKKPMSVEAKVRMFQLLVDTGFKEIEVGFPSASKVERDFMRRLIEDDLIPDDVTVQVLVQARHKLIERTFESLRGVKKAIVHVYNSTSELQRRVVFSRDRAAIRELATEGAGMLEEEANRYPQSEFVFQYSPESFTGTELDFSLDVCDAVSEVWKPTPGKKMVLNLPATVEMSMPNVHADQIEWMSRNLARRDSIILSVHTHNDRGTGIAATELALLAGADRVEGTLFGNGERTGNCDLTTVALNLFSQGVDPELDFTDINKLADGYQVCTGMPIHPRHPYVGDLVYTAFSGSHQDAIAKGMRAREKSDEVLWEVPYLPIDPHDVGRNYESIIRINSQSGKGGAAYILDSVHGITLPKSMQVEFQSIVQRKTEEVGSELTPESIWACFSEEYLTLMEPIQLLEVERTCADVNFPMTEAAVTRITYVLEIGGYKKTMTSNGTGPLDAFTNGLNELFACDISILQYEEHALGSGADVAAVAYVKISVGKDEPLHGAGINTDISLAAMKAVVSACNRASRKGIIPGILKQDLRLERAALAHV